VAVLLAACGSDKAPDTTVAVAADKTAADTSCPGAAAKAHTWAEQPKSEIDVSKTYNATMVTSKGTMEFVLEPKRAPVTVNSFVFLARQRFFDCIGFHRVVHNFVLQGGDPYSIDNGASGQIGTGGPGYSFIDELPQQGEYKLGSLAMANSGPNTNGSQFFIISGPDGEKLPPLYSLFGEITSGKDVLTAIDALGVTDGPPSEPVTIISVRVSES
jgi:cyclophilin family peptidyl-prolyl cis-trans isomerase